MKKIVIIGAGGFGREMAWLIEDINKIEKQFEIVGFLDDDKEKKNQVIYDYRVIGSIEDIDQEDIYFVCAIGSAKVKEIMVKRALKNNLKPVTLIHPTVQMGRQNKIGNGVIICAGNIITVNTEIQDYVTINLNCTIGHDTRIEKFSTLYPGVNLSGQCIVEKKCELGTNSAIIQGKNIGENSIVGAGSVVIKNIDKNKKMVGVPAKEI